MRHERSTDMSFIGRAIRLAVCAVIMMFMACAPVMVQADDAHSHDAKTFEAWTETGSLPAENGSYYLTDDISLDSAWEVRGEVNLCLNGHSITYTGDEASNVVTVNEGNTLNLYDCSGDSGSITGGTAGGVCVTGGTFDMYGGSITENTGGPGLCIEGSDEAPIVITQLKGGSITGNTNADGNGGGLQLKGSAVAMMSNGFTVSGNEAKNGGGVYCGDSGLLMSLSNVFENNKASENGGAVYVADTAGGASIDSATIRNNTAGRDGGGLYIDIGSGSTSGVIVSGSTVTGNQASRNGGGAYYKNSVSDPVLQISGAVVINNNMAAGSRNNLYITDGSKFTSFNRVDSGTRIGVTMQSVGIFTSNFINNANTQDPRAVFFSDKAGFEVDVTEDGKEALLKPGDFYNITIADSEHGSVTASRYNAAAGAEIELTPAPDDGYFLESITVTGEDGEIEVQDNSFVMPACDVTVTAAFEQKPVVPVTSVSLDDTELSITEGQTAKLKAAVEPEDATNKTITWSTSDTSIATVSDDGTVTAVSEGSATITVTTEDGEKTATCDVTVKAPEFTVTFTDGQGNTLETQQVERGRDAAAPTTPVIEGFTFDRWDKEFTNITADLTVNAIWKSDNAIEYVDAKGDTLYQNEYTVVKGDTIHMPSGWYAVKGTVDAQSRVSVEGDVNLILCDGCDYNATAGISVPEGKSLTIWCQGGKEAPVGFLNAGNGGKCHAAIGGSEVQPKFSTITDSAGTITVNGGLIEAHGGSGCAGIGAGWVNSLVCVSFTMNAGTVRAYGGTEAAGIGCGAYGSGGIVTINGGTVEAYGGAGSSSGQGGDGIGTGRAGYNIGDVTITGGTVYAEGKNGGAGIGCFGSGQGSAHVRISGGNVTAIGNGGAGIGTRRYDSSVENDGGSARITGGKVKAISTSYGGGSGRAIGEGYRNGSYEYTGAGLGLGDEMRVKAGSNEASAVYAESDLRIEKARGNTFAYIDKCDHNSRSYVINADTHIWHCDHCMAADEAEPHNFNDEGVCEDCGASVYTITFDSNGGSGSMGQAKVVGGRKYKLPACGFTAPAGKAFTGWDYDGGENKPVGTEVTMEHNLVLRAHWEDLTWATLQKYLDTAAPGTTITLDRDLTATNSDTALTVPQDSTITLDLNGHTLDRNLSGKSPVNGGSVLYIHPSKFTIKNGTLTGGFAPRGGGVLVDEYFRTANSESFNLIDINIVGNTASVHGGGIYSDWGYGTITRGSISNNHAWQRGGGVIAAKDNWKIIIDGTAITNNRAGTSGGGIFAEADVVVKDVTITSNTCGGQEVHYSIHDGGLPYQIDRDVVFEGGGVFVNGGASYFEACGTTIIEGNTSTYGGSHANNAYLRVKGERHTHSDTRINVDDLTEGSRIGITYEIKDPPPDDRTTYPVRITDYLPGNGSLSNFFADESGYLTGLDSNGEVIMGKTARTVTLKPGNGQGTPISEQVLIKSQYKLPGKPDSFTAPDDMFFIGWLDENTSTLYYEGQSVYNITQNIVLTTQWGTPWQLLQSKIDRASSGSTITLDCDYTALPDVDTTLIIPNGKKITIDLNGHTLDRADLSSTVIEIGTGSALTLRDTSGVESDGITGIIGGKTGVSVNQNATFTMESGKISGNETTGVDVHAGGTFNMSGGCVTANYFGVVLPKGAAMNISNTLKVTQNKNNVILAEGVVLKRTARLLNGAEIGITTETPPTKESPEVVITSNLGTVSTSFFRSDDRNYEIVKLNGYSGEAYLTLAVASATVTSADDLVYTGEPQTLVTVKDVTGGTVMFATSEEGPFTETLPVATDAGRYNYWYKIVGDENHRDSEVIGPGAVTITKATPDIGEVTADDVIGSLDPAGAHLTRSDETIPGTLTLDETSLELGTNTYHWTFTPEDTKNYKIATGTVEITVHDHEWTEPIYEWADDNSSVTATCIAKDDSSIVQTETVETTSERTKDPTCSAKGETTYTAVFTKNGFETQTKTVANIAIDPDAHKWGEWTETTPATETAEGEETRACEHNSNHKETRSIPALDHVHRLSHIEAKPATCTEDGNIEYWVCDNGDNPCKRLFDKDQATADDEINKEDTIIKANGHTQEEPVSENEVPATCEQTGSYDSVVYCDVCGTEISRTMIEIPKLPHEWGEWKVTKESTANEDGVRTRECSLCHKTETEAIPAKGGDSEPEPKPAPGSDPDQKGKDGTAVGPGASEAAADRAIRNLPNDNGPAGTRYSPLRLQSKKQSKISINLTWANLNGAAEYVVYGALSGKSNRMTKLASIGTNTMTVKDIGGVKLKKGKYYKFIVVALDSNKTVISTSKVAHVATKGGKVGNHKKVKVKKSAVSKAKKLKVGKTLKLKAKAVKAGKKVKKRRAVSYESTDPGIATVSKKGVVKGKNKGACYIYAYAQNGVAKKIKIVVN